jgi:hypothetical protein
MEKTFDCVNQLEFYGIVGKANLFFLWLDSPIWAWASSFRRGFTITHFRHTTFGRTTLDEGPARRRDLYLTTYNTHKRQTYMTPVGFEPTILAVEP